MVSNGLILIFQLRSFATLLFRLYLFLYLANLLTWLRFRVILWLMITTNMSSELKLLSSSSLEYCHAKKMNCKTKWIRRRRFLYIWIKLYLNKRFETRTKSGEKMKKDLIRTVGGLFRCPSMDQSEHSALSEQGERVLSRQRLGFVFHSFFLTLRRL